MSKLRIFCIKLSFEVRNTFIITVYFDKSALQNVYGLVKYLSKCLHRWFSSAIGLSLTPNLVNNPQTKIFVQLPPGLFVEYTSQFLFGEQCLFVQIVWSEHLEYSTEIIEFFVLHRYNLIHGKCKIQYKSKSYTFTNHFCWYLIKDSLR